MKLALKICALSLAAALASTSAMAASSSVTNPAPTAASGQSNATGTATASDNGMSSLGVDISNAGTTSTSVQGFTTNLSPTQQAQVKTGCQKVSASPNDYAANVQAFCKNQSM